MNVRLNFFLLPLNSCISNVINITFYYSPKPFESLIYEKEQIDKK